jgi:hypothetical protein
VSLSGTRGQAKQIAPAVLLSDIGRDCPGKKKGCTTRTRPDARQEGGYVHITERASYLWWSQTQTGVGKSRHKNAPLGVAGCNDCVSVRVTSVGHVASHSDICDVLSSIKKIFPISRCGLHPFPFLHIIFVCCKKPPCDFHQFKASTSVDGCVVGSGTIFYLDEPTRLRAVLIMLAVKLIMHQDRVETIGQSIQAMSVEEAYY